MPTKMVNSCSILRKAHNYLNFILHRNDLLWRTRNNTSSVSQSICMVNWLKSDKFKQKYNNVKETVSRNSTQSFLLHCTSSYFMICLRQCDYVIVSTISSNIIFDFLSMAELNRLDRHKRTCSSLFSQVWLPRYLKSTCPLSIPFTWGV